MQLLLSDFIGWIILLSRVATDYAAILLNARWPVHPPEESPHRNSCAKNTYAQNYFFKERLLKAMKPATIIGGLLILLGIVGFVSGGFSFTHQHKDIDAGPIQVSHDKKETVPISPILSTIALVAGAGLVVVGVRAK